MDIYVVKQGDNVDYIAAATGVSAEQIIRQNQLVYPYELAVGQALFIEKPANMTEGKQKILSLIHISEPTRQAV